MGNIYWKERQQYVNYQAKISMVPNHILRYCFEDNARPLWPSLMHIPINENIPNCPNCGAKRYFEFQVLPRIINFLEQNTEEPESVDWDMIAIYTCPKSCISSKKEFEEEFVWIQPASPILCIY